MLELSNVHVVFNKGTVNEKHALKGVNLTINQGDFVTVIGGNGAGKSTMLNSIAGAFSIESGSIKLDGVEISKLPDYKRASFISRVFQDPLIGTAGNMSIEENLALAARRGKRRTLKWYTNNEEREYFKALLAEFDLGLEDRMMQKVGTLSGGQRQAITLLMASLASPKLLLLDEHTAALDPKTALKVLNVTKKIAGQNNLTVLMITHNMSDAIAYGNKLIMMNEGNIVFTSEGEEKKELTIPFLMDKFERTVGEKLGGDKMLLG
ncbi:MAG: ATP-binding cassette domain-containing protein [Clostridiales bacterium]|nr:ATP-binding cassette domain-containing protein [Clostridiales bacterium]